MTVISSEIKFMNPTVINTAVSSTTNGGRMTSSEIAAATKNNVWPDADQAELTAGSTKHRKIFVKIANDNEESMLNSKIYVKAPTSGDDRVNIFAGTQTDTQGDLSGSEAMFGAGTLDSDVSASATEIDVQTEVGADLIFRDGVLVRISDGTNTEYHRIAASSGVSYASDVATLTLQTALANAYTAATPTYVSSVVEAGTIVTSVDNNVVTSASGTYTASGGNLTADAIGCIDETITITMGSGDAFTAAGSISGSLGAGTRSSNFAPNNADFTKPYFTLLSAGWGGTWLSGDTYVFQTHPAAAPIWEKRIIPAAASSLASNQVEVEIDGETS